MSEHTSPERGFDALDTTTLLHALHRLGLAGEQGDLQEEAPVTGVSDTVRAAAGAKLAGIGNRLLADHSSTGNPPLQHWLFALRDAAAGYPEAEARLRAVVQRLAWDRSLLATFSASSAMPEAAPLRPLLEAAAMTIGAAETLVLSAVAEALGAQEGRSSSVSEATADLRTVLDQLARSEL